MNGEKNSHIRWNTKNVEMLTQAALSVKCLELLVDGLISIDNESAATPIITSWKNLCQYASKGFVDLIYSYPMSGVCWDG
jgi:hypothetical protein